MISCEQFDNLYWVNYVALEKEFLQTCKYVTLSDDNFDTYSSSYLKLLLEIGSEVDIVLKEYCKMLDASFAGSTVSDYRACVLAHEPSYLNQKVMVNEGMINLTPWDNRDANGDYISPFWWKAYNKCKHCRTEVGMIEGQNKEYYKFANLKYTLNALAGLYQTYIFLYKILADSEGKEIKVPLPGSRIFRLDGGVWSSITFYKDVAFWIDENGYLIYETGRYPW